MASITQSMVELFRFRTLLEYLVVLDLRLRYRGSVLGFLWTLLNPLLLMLVMWAVFSRFGKVSEKNYALFLLSGLSLWIFFQQSIDRSLGAIISNRGLLQKVRVPRLIFPIAMVGSNFLNLLFFIAAYLVAALLFGYGVPVTAFFVPAALLMLLLLAAGAVLFMSALAVFFRDLTHLTPVLMRALFYLTPVLYRPTILGEQAHRILALNPAYYPVVAARELLYDGTVPDAQFWAIGYAAALVVFIVGLVVFTRTQEQFVYYA